LNGIAGAARQRWPIRIRRRAARGRQGGRCDHAASKKDPENATTAIHR
jgi:hypothetical protein